MWKEFKQPTIASKMSMYNDYMITLSVKAFIPWMLWASRAEGKRLVIFVILFKTVYHCNVPLPVWNSVRIGSRVFNFVSYCVICLSQYSNWFNLGSDLGTSVSFQWTDEEYSLEMIKVLCGVKWFALNGHEDMEDSEFCGAVDDLVWDTWIYGLNVAYCMSCCSEFMVNSGVALYG